MNAPDAMCWTLTRHGSVAILSFARPPINMISFKAAGELLTALDQIAADQQIALVILTGDVPHYFIAHADLDDIGRMARGEVAQGDPQDLTRAINRLESMPQPTIAAVNGQAWGGGCEVALACTLRIAAHSAHFRLHEVSKGAIPGGGGTQRLPRLIGMGRATVMIMASRLVMAEEALTMGLVDVVLPDENFMDHVLEWLAPIRAQPPHALAAAKRAIVDGLRMDFAEGLRNEQRLFAQAISSPDFADK